MAISHRLVWQKLGYLKPTRRFSSSSFFSGFSFSTKTRKSSQSKKTEAAKEQKTVAVESYVKKFMQINQGNFPKATQVHKEVRGSWYLLKDILTDLKEKMLNNLQIQKQNPSERLDEMVDTAASKARIAGECLETADVDKLKSRVQPSEGVTEPLHKNNNSTIPSHVAEEKSPGDIVKSEDPSNCVKLVESGDGVEFETNSSAVFANVTDDKSSAAIDKSEDTSNCVKLIESMDGDEFEANSSADFTPDRDHNAASTEVSFLVRGLVSGEENKTRALGLSGDVTSVENGDHSSNKKVTTCLAANGTSKPKGTYSSSGGVEKIRRLADLFTKQNIDAKLLDYDSLAPETSSTSGDDSVMRDIKGLIDRVKKLNVDTSHVTSHNYIITNKSNQLKNGGLPKDKSATPFTLRTSNFSDLGKQQKSRSKPYICDVLKKHVQDGRQMKKLKEINLPHLALKDQDKDTLTKRDDSDTCNRTNLLDDNEEDPTEHVPFETFSSGTLGYFGTESSSDVEAFDIKPEPSPKSSQPNKRASQKRDINSFLFTAKGKNQTNLLVRFLRKSVNDTEIGGAFKDCGPIAEVRFIHSKEESWFKDAYICFKTKEGLQRALAKTDAIVSSNDVVLSSAAPSTNMPNKILPPNVVKDLEVPAALLENPTQTVMLKCLPHDLASHHLREAFSFCGGQISSFFMGASNSVAYVEFKTEDAKEKAIAASSITVSGKQISVLRIDSPITTVVRISNVKLDNKVHITCSLHGKVKRVVQRGSNTVDVHFKLAEWPNMVKILNSLNGLVVNERQWIVLPAPVIPVEILQSLWSQHGGRRQVGSVIQNLLQKLGESPIGLAELNSLADQFYMEKSIK